MRKRIPSSMNDLLAGVFLVLVIGIIGVEAMANARQTANLAKCASNLHQIGLAILLYQNENQQSYPRTVQDTTGNPKPTWGTPYEGDKEMGPVAHANPFNGSKQSPAPNDVTAAFYLLLTNEQITPGVFICPETKLKPWDFGGGAHTALDYTNWQGKEGLAQHLSYSYANMYASNTAIANGFQWKNPDATYAVASDMNPGGDAVTSVKMNSPAKDLLAANSLNHGQTGQNVLYGDGHAEFWKTPFCGSQHDNIFTAAGPEIPAASEPDRKGAVIIASPVSSTDSILLPTAADIGYTGPPPAKPMTPQDAAKMKSAILGTYVAEFPRQHGGDKVTATLVIDEKTIKFTAGPINALFNYEVTGSEQPGLKLKLTGPDTNETAAVGIDGNKLILEGGDDSDFFGLVLHFEWVRK